MSIKQVPKRYLQNTVEGRYVTLDFLDLVRVVEDAVTLSRDKVDVLAHEVRENLSLRRDNQAYYSSGRLAKATKQYELGLEVLHSLTALQSEAFNRTEFRLFNLNPSAVTIVEGEED